MTFFLICDAYYRYSLILSVKTGRINFLEERTGIEQAMGRIHFYQEASSNLSGVSGVEKLRFFIIETVQARRSCIHSIRALYLNSFS